MLMVVVVVTTVLLPVLLPEFCGQGGEERAGRGGKARGQDRENV
jgi:hypothetical protein